MLVACRIASLRALLNSMERHVITARHQLPTRPFTTHCQKLHLKLFTVYVPQEGRTLGRGAYGVVVAAVNRLDGRQYAVKRIRLDSASPAAFARLLREVATLSRLQHAHVVRYFQV